MNKKTKLGQIQIYTGDGKGKTTAALGLAIRAAGQGKKVGIVFFDKGGVFYGERKSLTKLEIDFWVTGGIRFKPGKPFRFGVNADDKKEATKGVDIARSLFQKKYDLVIMDEANSSMGLKMLEPKLILDLIKTKPAHTELVLTGRYCPPAVIKQASLVTEMKLKKHYFNQGIPCRKGIEF